MSILVSSIFIALLIYFCYKKYNSDIEVAYFRGGAQARAFDYWLVTHRKKVYEKFLKSDIYLDLHIITRDENVKHSMDIKRYCPLLQDIKNDMKEYNRTSEKIIDSLCNKK